MSVGVTWRHSRNVGGSVNSKQTHSTFIGEAVTHTLSLIVSGLHVSFVASITFARASFPHAPPLHLPHPFPLLSPCLCIPGSPPTSLSLPEDVGDVRVQTEDPDHQRCRDQYEGPGHALKRLMEPHHRSTNRPHVGPRPLLLLFLF